MSSLDKLFANSLKNDITSSFVESVEAIMFLEGISSEDFLITNQVKVYTPAIKDSLSFSPSKKLTFSDDYSHEQANYDILSVWLYKLSENLRRIYSATKQDNDFSSLIEQQNNLYTISNYLLDYWDTKNEGAFFPRAIFGRHMDYLEPLDYLLYLGTHDCLTSKNFSHHLKIVEKFSPKYDFSDIPEFIPKLALSAKNSKLFKTILPLFNHDALLMALLYRKSSDGFKILSMEYILENQNLFDLANYQKVDLVQSLLREDTLLSRHFDNFILDKSSFLDKLSHFITPEVTKGIEVLFVNKSKKNSHYKNLENVFLKNQKKSNPYSLIHELKTLSFEEIQDSYCLSPELVSETIDKIIEGSVLKQNKHKDYYLSCFKNLVDKLHPVLQKEHLATIISLDSEFVVFCRPVYLSIKLNEKLPTKSEDSASFGKKNKI